MELSQRLLSHHRQHWNPVFLVIGTAIGIAILFGAVFHIPSLRAFNVEGVVDILSTASLDEENCQSRSTAVGSPRRMGDHFWNSGEVQVKLKKVHRIVATNVSIDQAEMARKMTLEELVKGAVRGADQVEPNAVILVAVSEAWATEGSIFDRFVLHWRQHDELRNLLQNLVVLCLDEATFIRCLKIHSFCYAPEQAILAANYSGGALTYMSSRYTNALWHKVSLVARVHKWGYNVLSIDLDVIFFRDPFPVFQALFPTQDWLASLDYWGGNNNDPLVEFNGGFYYARHTNSSLRMYELWQEGAGKFATDQEGLNQLKRDLNGGGKYGSNFTLQDIHFGLLPTHIFGGLCQMPCTWELFCKVVTIHTNCCIGQELKMSLTEALIQDHATMTQYEGHVDRAIKSLWSAFKYRAGTCAPEWKGL